MMQQREEEKHGKDNNEPIMSNQEDIFRNLIESFPAQIQIHDLKGALLYSNNFLKSEEYQEHEQENGTSTRREEEEGGLCLEFPLKSYDTTSATSASSSATSGSENGAKKNGRVIGTCTCQFSSKVLKDITNEGGASTSSKEEEASKKEGASEETSSSSSSSGMPYSDDMKFKLPPPANDTQAQPKLSTPANNDNTQAKAQEQPQEQDQEQSVAQSYDRMIQDFSMIPNFETGIALCQMVVKEEQDKLIPTDYAFLRVNPSFLSIVGLQDTFYNKYSDNTNNDISNKTCINGKLLTKVFPGIENDPVDWIKHFGNVAIHGGSYKYTQFSNTMQKWYTGVAFQTDPTKYQFGLIFMEITEQFQHQHEQLQESEERHRNLFESMMQGVVYQDAQGSIIAANPAAERILGLTVDQMMGKTSIDPLWRAVRHDGSDFPGHEHPAMMALQLGKPVTNVTMGVFHQGDAEDSNHWIKVDAVPRFREGEDRPYQVYATFTDITETTRFERRLLNAKKKAEESDKLKSAFLANMSHEIRTPLNGIIGHIDLALSNHLAPEWQKENLEGLQIAKSSGQLLINIIQDILDLSKIEAGQMIVQDDEPFSLQTTIMDHTKALANTLIKSKHKGNSISFYGIIQDDNGLLQNTTILGDPFRLQQILNNLVSNAIKFTNVGKVELRIRLLKDRKTLEFSLLDTGKGIPATHVETIFEPFRQVEIGDTRLFGGTGLGLTISRKLVEMMGGSLRLESSVLGPIRGSMFAFTLPYRPSLQHHSSPASASSTIQRSPPPSPSSKKPIGSGSSCAISDNVVGDGGDDEYEQKILVAEDDPVSRKLVSRMLQRSGYTVLLACDGREAIALYQAHKRHVALILMDVQMPHLSGHEATEAIRHLEKTLGDEPVPIIALSAGAMKGDLEKGLLSGMTDYLTKPVDFQGLVRTLDTYLGGVGNMSGRSSSQI